MTGHFAGTSADGRRRYRTPPDVEWRADGRSALIILAVTADTTPELGEAIDVGDTGFVVRQVTRLDLRGPHMAPAERMVELLVDREL